MANYTLVIRIDREEIERLSSRGAQLCIAKKCNDTYDTVWKCMPRVGMNNQFSWTEQYQVFGSNTFQDGMMVQAVTNAVPIQCGQTAILDNTPNMNPATGQADNSGTFTVSNQDGSTSIGVNSMINGSWSPIYNSRDTSVGNLELAPGSQVLLFFAAEYNTGTMFSQQMVQNPFEIDFRDVVMQSVSYASGRWNITGGDN